LSSVVRAPFIYLRIYFLFCFSRLEFVWFYVFSYVWVRYMWFLYLCLFVCACVISLCRCVVRSLVMHVVSYFFLSVRLYVFSPLVIYLWVLFSCFFSYVVRQLVTV